MSRDPTITHGYVRCPDCGERLCGYLDVTVNPMLRADGTMGPLTEGMSEIWEQARSHFAHALSDEWYCSAACGYRIGPGDLGAFLRRCT